MISAVVLSRPLFSTASLTRRSAGWRRGGGFRVAKNFHDVIVVKAFDEAVGAEQKDIAGFITDGAELRVHELISAAEGFLEDAAAGMGAGFAFVDFAVAKQPADVRVVVA